MAENGGYIYVLTNPSFREYVKIGYADNVDERLAQLNRSECTPFAFRKYAVLHVKSRLADKNVHKLIDSFKPELRARENVNGKMRVREFFSMSPQEAVELLASIGSIYGETPQVFAQTEEEKAEQELAEKTAIATERKSPFSFNKCGICAGETIFFVNDPAVICTVTGDREITYKGKKTSLSALAKKLLNVSHSVQGTLYFTYKGEVLSALRKRLEDEGAYNGNTVTEPAEVNSAQAADENMTAADENITEGQGGDILYFTMEKYGATCRRTEEGYLLLKGSKISPNVSESGRRDIQSVRQAHSASISSDYVLTQDILFKSPSGAAKFVTGTSVNGKLCWKNKDGVLLKNLLETE